MFLCRCVCIGVCVYVFYVGVCVCVGVCRSVCGRVCMQGCVSVEGLCALVWAWAWRGVLTSGGCGQMQGHLRSWRGAEGRLTWEWTWMSIPYAALPKEGWRWLERCRGC